MHSVEEFNEGAVGDCAGVEGYLEGFGVFIHINMVNIPSNYYTVGTRDRGGLLLTSCPPRTNIPISRFRRLSPTIPNLRINKTLSFSELAPEELFHAPEAACRESGFLGGHFAGLCLGGEVEGCAGGVWAEETGKEG